MKKPRMPKRGSSILGPVPDLIPSKRRRGNVSEINDTGEMATDDEQENMTDEEENDEALMELSQQPDFNQCRTMNKEAEVGIVEKISVKNFMCHSRLDLELGPHVNFIVGRNGSGKSAALAALVIGLGGKASATNRGTTIKSFIKTGKNVAEVQIRLRNRGADAFKPDLYGDSIIVERKFTSDGVGQYKLKGKDGHVVSTKREELDHILDQFNIQVDNPVAVLNQDTSKNFLNSKSSHDKYKFFLKATQLEQMKQDYNEANDQKKMTESIIDIKVQSLPKLEDEVLEWEQKFKSLTSLDDLREKVKRLKHEMAWALVHEKEKGLEPILKDLKVEDSRMPKFIAKVTEAKKKQDELVKAQREIQEKLKSLGEQVQKLGPQHEQCQKHLKEKKDRSRKVQMEVRQMERNVKNTAEDRDQMLKRIEDIRNTVTVDYESERLEREKQISVLEEKCSSLKAQQKTTEHQHEQFASAIQKYREDSHQNDMEEIRLKHSFDEKRRRKQLLESARSDRLKRYGAWMPAVIQAIDDACHRNRFKERPRGPLGAAFQLKDSKWALAIERCLKPLLYSFCCDNHNDANVLEQIFAQVVQKNTRKPSIIVSRFKHQIHDVTTKRVMSRDYPAVLDLISTDDPVVINCLIDQRSIENILLMSNEAEAIKVMQRTPPAKATEAFTEIASQIYCRPNFRFYASDMNSAKLLTANVEEEITVCEREMAILGTEMEQIRGQKQQLLTSLRENETHERRTRTQLMKIGQETSKLTYEISELKTVEDPTPVDVSTLEDEVQAYDTRLKDLQTQLDVKKEAYVEAQKNQQTASAEFTEIDQQMRVIVENGEPLKEEVANTVNEIEIAKSHKQHYESKHRELQKKVQEITKRKEKFQKELDSDIAKAEQICAERIRVRRTAVNVESEINQINIRIKAEEKIRGNAEEITKKYYDTKSSLNKIKKEVGQMKAFLTKLREMMLIRDNQYSSFKQMIALRARYCFIVMLSNRKYTGKLGFNHDKETLNIVVQPNTGNTTAAKDTRSLSGGERSFATVCFITALWEAISSPFRCLDEFDVFMDMVNRRISMDMMLVVANKKPGCQFIFLTPQDMSQLNMSKHCRILRMPDPDRGQSTLTFEPSSQSSERNEST